MRHFVSKDEVSENDTDPQSEPPPELAPPYADSQWTPYLLEMINGSLRPFISPNGVIHNDFRPLYESHHSQAIIKPIIGRHSFTGKMVICCIKSNTLHAKWIV